jgi:hypothetical protein
VDPALLRPGRLDKPLYCNFPDEEERYQIFQSVSAKFDNLASNADKCMRDIAQKYSQFTGADIQALLYTAKLSAVHESSEKITAKHIMDAAKSTRPSVSPADRSKFLKIFAKFRDEEETNQGGAHGESKVTSGNGYMYGGNSGSGSGVKQTLTKEQQEALLGKLASFGYDIDDIKQGKQRLATA